MPHDDLSILSGRRLLVAVTGGIAAYKTCTLVSRATQAGAAVTVLMTDSATKFVTPLTFETLSGRPVYTTLWQPIENHDAQHISLARACDLMVIAPATANTIAKLAHGICDDLVSSVACAVPAKTPLLLAPAMNADMWANPITQDNLKKLIELRGVKTVGPEEGWQACRTSGPGRMSEPETILSAIAGILSPVRA